MQSPPLHHPVPQHRINLDAVNANSGSPYGTAPQYGGYNQQTASQGYGFPPQGAAQGAPQSASYQNYAAGAQAYPQSYGAQPHAQAAGSQQPAQPFNPLNFVDQSQIGQQAFNYGHDYLSRSFGSYVRSAISLQYYFQVSTSYVRQKLLIILFPWRHKPWSRQLQPVQGDGTQDAYAFPSEDVNAPDMYIPMMAFITHLVVIALVQGMRNEFHPEQFSARASRALGLVAAELVLLKLFAYLLAASNSSLADLFAYSGYKFIAVTLTTLCELVSSKSTLKWSVFAYTSAATAFFMLRSLKYILLPEYSAQNPTTTLSGSRRQQRIQFLFFYGIVCQQLLMYFLL